VTSGSNVRVQIAVMSTLPTGARQRLRRAVVLTVLRRGAVLAVLVVIVEYLAVPQLVGASRSLDLLG
jgi:hypothetical protein